MKNCGWLRSRWHRRLRAIDRRVLMPGILAAVARRAAERGTYTREYIDAESHAAFALHQSLPGQEHWRCACAIREEATS